jgi:type IV pilus assembly protein PilA
LSREKTFGNVYIDSTRRKPVHHRQHKEEVVKRKGFTLIELMVVIAIIIILAAIAIPNYLKMTERAKKSRLAADFATLATVLETYKTDWGKYPTATAYLAVSDPSTLIYRALAGVGADLNTASSTNAVGEVGPIEYIKPGTLTSMTNPFNTTNTVKYGSATGTNWVVYADTDLGGALEYFSRTDGQSTPVSSTATPSIP